MKKKKVKIGLAPTRRNVFSVEDSLKYKALIEKKLKSWDVDYVNLDSLNEEGIFVIGDIIKFDTEKETRQKEEEWKEFFRPNFNEKEANYWFANYKEEDLPSSTMNQLKWLQEAGFKEVGVSWEHINFAVIYGKK